MPACASRKHRRARRGLPCLLFVCGERRAIGSMLGVGRDGGQAWCVNGRDGAAAQRRRTTAEGANGLADRRTVTTSQRHPHLSPLGGTCAAAAAALRAHRRQNARRAIARLKHKRDGSGLYSRCRVTLACCGAPTRLLPAHTLLVLHNVLLAHTLSRHAARTSDSRTARAQDINTSSLGRNAAFYLLPPVARFLTSFCAHAATRERIIMATSDARRSRCAQPYGGYRFLLRLRIARAATRFCLRFLRHGCWRMRDSEIAPLAS